MTVCSLRKSQTCETVCCWVSPDIPPSSCRFAYTSPWFWRTASQTGARKRDGKLYRSSNKWTQSRQKQTKHYFPLHLAQHKVKGHTTVTRLLHSQQQHQMIITRGGGGLPAAHFTLCSALQGSVRDRAGAAQPPQRLASNPARLAGIVVLMQTQTGSLSTHSESFISAPWFPLKLILTAPHQMVILYISYWQLHIRWLFCISHTDSSTLDGYFVYLNAQIIYNLLLLLMSGQLYSGPLAWWFWYKGTRTTKCSNEFTFKMGKHNFLLQNLNSMTLEVDENSVWERRANGQVKEACVKV